ncbi:MAG: glycosyltransferase family 9 protein [Deltaproteobacteria bacterium]|nr:glycosyltransferase family 9 protein [Deltaproteobacteria bacterium]MCX7952140.1 glycosyltransferase family 9 protein [Deltaproteobacteria bacterium]
MRDTPVPTPRNCLIVNFARLGDLIQMSPALVGLKKEHPANRITLMTTTTFGEIAKLLPCVDELELVDLDWIIKKLSHDLVSFNEVKQVVEDLLSRMKDKKFGFSANLSSMGASAILIKYLNSPCLRGWTSDESGFRVLSSRWSRLLSTMLSGINRFYNSFNVVDFFRFMCEAKIPTRSLSIKYNDQFTEDAASLLKSFGGKVDSPFVVVHAGVSQMKRSWKAECFAKFSKALIEKTGWQIVLTGSGNEALLTKVLKEEINHPNVIDLGDRTSLSQLIGIIKLCKGILTGDTGPLHISAALGKPSVSLFVASGWPYETGPYFEGQIILRPKIICGPCSPNGFCSTLECHDLIDVNQLVELFINHVEAEFGRVEKIASEIQNCYVYQTTFDEFGIFNLKQLNNEYDRHKYMRKCYRYLILNEFENLGEIHTSTKFFDFESEKLFSLAKKGEEICKLLINKLNSGSNELEESCSQLELLDDEIVELAHISETIGLLARLYMFEKESIVGDVFELANLTLQNYTDLQNRILKLNWLIDRQEEKVPLHVVN